MKEELEKTCRDCKSYGKEKTEGFFKGTAECLNPEAPPNFKPYNGTTIGASIPCPKFEETP